jgi:hypothetical protein
MAELPRPKTHFEMPYPLPRDDKGRFLSREQYLSGKRWTEKRLMPALLRSFYRPQ